MVATQTDSAVFSFLPHSIGSPVKGSRQLAAEGLTAINYQLLAIRCGQRSLVGNGFIRSAVMVLPVQKTIVVGNGFIRSVFSVAH